jgi:hypothetical protein
MANSTAATSDAIAELPLARKLVLAGLLVSFTGTWVLGEIMIVRNTQMADGEPGLACSDVVAQFDRGYGSLLQAFVENDMRVHTRSREEVEIVSTWARDGGGREGYDARVAKILDERCVGCHTPRGDASFRPLETFEQAQAAALAPSAPSFAKQLLTSKVHLVGIGLMIGAVATMFTRSRLGRGRAGAFIVATAFLGLFADFASWWLMRVDTGFAWGRLIGHGAMALGFACMCLAVARDLTRKQE